MHEAEEASWLAPSLQNSFSPFFLRCSAMGASSLRETFTQGLGRSHSPGMITEPADSVCEKQRLKQNHWSVVRFTVVQPHRLEKETLTIQKPATITLFQRRTQTRRAISKIPLREACIRRTYCHKPDVLFDDWFRLQVAGSSLSMDSRFNHHSLMKSNLDQGRNVKLSGLEFNVN